MNKEVTYKQYESLGDYLLTDRGLVYELDTMQQVELVPDNVHRNNYGYKLLSDDTVYLETKNKIIRLWRRYTPEDIIKMYNSKQAKVFTDAVPSAQVTQSAQVVSAQVIECTGSESAQVKAGKSAQVVINGTVYKSISDASTQLNINRRTIKKRLDDALNADYAYE